MKKRLSICLISVFLLISCEKQNDDGVAGLDYAGNKKASDLVQTENQFGLELFRKVASSIDCPQNVMISPVSVAFALGMTYNGAEGSTKSAFEETLRLQGFTREEINNIHFSLINHLVSSDSRVTLDIANSIWYKRSFSVLPSFINANKDYYHAEVNSLDFSDPGSKDIINNWIARNTNNKLQNVLDYIPADAVMYLINALYYNGLWKYAFDERSSFYGLFYGEGKELGVKYMRNINSYSNYQNELFNAVELPYGSGHFVMNILLPMEGKDIGDILDQMSHENWKIWTDAFAVNDKILVQIPKFKFEYKSLLNDWLCKMGLEEAFDGRADFSGINGNDDLFISRVIHQAFIDVNEKGTEAAAATVIEIKESSAGLKTPGFIVNRPFIFSIREKNTGAILFLGKVGNPYYY